MKRFDRINTNHNKQHTHTLNFPKTFLTPHLRMQVLASKEFRAPVLKYDNASFFFIRDANLSAHPR